MEGSRKVVENVAEHLSEFETLRGRLSLDAGGGLTLNGQSMILLPRHFFRYILRDVNAVAGPQAFRKIFHKAGYDGALTFCRRFREFHGCTPRDAVEGYLKEMSLRGWGQFRILLWEPESGRMEVLLTNSALAGEESLPSGNLIWEGAMLGAMAFLRESIGRPSETPTRARGEEVPGEKGKAPDFRIVVGPEPARDVTS